MTKRARVWRLGLTLAFAASVAHAQTVTLLGVADNQNVRGMIAVQAKVTESGVQSVSFTLDGPEVKWHLERFAPYYFLGDQSGVPRGWNTTAFPDGEYRLSATALDDAARATTTSVRFRVTNHSFYEGFSRTELGAAWVESGWTVVNGAAHNFERGYAPMQTADGIPAMRFVLESRATGFGPTQGPSPSDSVDLVFGRNDLAANNYYRVSYFPSSAGLLALQRVYEVVPGGEFTVQTLAYTNVTLANGQAYRLRVVRDCGTGLTQVYLDKGAGFGATPLLQAVDKAYATLGHFGWILESQAPGNFDVDSISARWEKL